MLNMRQLLGQFSTVNCKVNARLRNLLKILAQHGDENRYRFIDGELLFAILTNSGSLFALYFILHSWH